ncbi:MAG: TonB-dependent receptor [Cyclobacteriaceae bacterium]
MKQLILSMLVAFAVTIQANAQSSGTIRGVVTDTEGNPLIGINVGLKGFSYGSATNDAGEYVINGIPNGHYTLILSGVGYEKKSVPVNIDGESIKLDFSLQEYTEQLQTVEVIGRKETDYKNEVSYIASKTATPLKDVPQAVSYVTKEVIADQQAYRIGDIAKNISGVNMFSGYDDFTFRGFRSGSSDSKMINGLRTVGIFGPQPILANIERVEVIKGPASALFANTTPGGTMNYVTKKPLSEERKALSFTVGSFNTLRAIADFTGAINEEGTLLYRLNLGYEDADSYRNLQQNKSLMVAPSISFLLTENTRINFDLAVTQYKGKLDRGQPIFAATSGTNLNSTPISFAIGESSDYHTNNVQNFTLSLNHRFTDDFSFNASYMRFVWDEDLFEHRTSNSFAVDSLGNQIPTLMGMQVINRMRKQISDNLTSYFVYSTKTGPLSHKLVAGFDYIQQQQPVGGGQSIARGYRLKDGSVANSYNPANADNYLFNNGIPIPNIPHFNLESPEYNVTYPHEYLFNIRQSYSPTRYYTYGFYLQDQISINRLKILLALRQENYRDVLNYDTPDEEKVEQKKLLPRLGLVYQLTNDINLYATYTESFQPQSASVLTDPNVGGPFDPLSANMWEVGAKSTLIKNRLAANLAIYRIEQNNILVNANDPINPDLLEQRGQEVSQGVELDVIGTITPNLSITANYAYNLAEITESDDVEQIGRIKENAPEHQGGIWTKYSIDRGVFNGLGIALGSNFVTERVTFDTYSLGLKLPGYVLFDAAIFYSVDKFRISANINNVLDKTHWTGGYSYTRLFPGAPRNYLLSVGYTF